MSLNSTVRSPKAKELEVVVRTGIETWMSGAMQRQLEQIAGNILKERYFLYAKRRAYQDHDRSYALWSYRIIRAGFWYRYSAQ